MPSTLEKLSKAGIVTVNQLSITFDTSSYTRGSEVVTATERLLRETPKPTKIIYTNVNKNVHDGLYKFYRNQDLHPSQDNRKDLELTLG